MTIKARIDKAEAESTARLKAERKAVIREFVTWIDTHTPAEQAALWRVARKESFDTDESPRALEICGGIFELQPGDESLVEAMLLKMPGDLVKRFRATDPRRLSGRG
jgi:hypothetical protein